MKSIVIWLCGVLLFSGCSNKPVQTDRVPAQTANDSIFEQLTPNTPPSDDGFLKSYWKEISGQTYVQETKATKAQCTKVYEGIMQGIADAEGQPDKELRLARLKLRDGIANYTCDVRIFFGHGLKHLKKSINYPQDWMKISTKEHNEACVITYTQIAKDMQSPAGVDLKIKKEIETSCSLLVGYQKDLRLRSEIYAAAAAP